MTMEPLMCPDEQAQTFTPFHVVPFGFQLNSPMGQQWPSGMEQAQETRRAH